jgi:hypothetical protein
MIIIIKKRYIMNDARRRRESREYVDVIMKIARSTKLESESHQILMYNDLNLKFQRNISMPELFTKIQNFLQCLNDKKNIWWKLVNRTRNSYNAYDQFRTYYQFDQQFFDQYDFQNVDQRINQWNSVNFYRFSNQFESANRAN